MHDEVVQGRRNSEVRLWLKHPIDLPTLDWVDHENLSVTDIASIPLFVKRIQFAGEEQVHWEVEIGDNETLVSAWQVRTNRHLFCGDTAEQTPLARTREEGKAWATRALLALALESISRDHWRGWACVLAVLAGHMPVPKSAARLRAELHASLDAANKAPPGD